MFENTPVDALRESGKNAFYNHGGDNELRNNGINMLIRAANLGDFESTFIVSKLMLEGVIKPKHGNPEEQSLILLQRIANDGYLPARIFLNNYCYERYNLNVRQKNEPTHNSQPLRDFNGELIKIKRKGFFTPIDAVLQYRNGKNILSLTANVLFLYDEDIPEFAKFKKAVLDGLYMWQGEYEVFNGQKVYVELNITTEIRLFDNLIISPMCENFSSDIRRASQLLNISEKDNGVNTIINSKRSFAVTGKKWSVNSSKIICIQSRSGDFDEYDEIMHVAKHEFGHALGIGDLYRCVDDSLFGVETGTYTELDSYAISNMNYNLVMCDHHGPISNNDIEMIILAFRENKFQLFQNGKIKGKISSALGKGN